MWFNDNSHYHSPFKHVLLLQFIFYLWVERIQHRTLAATPNITVSNNQMHSPLFTPTNNYYVCSYPIPFRYRFIVSVDLSLLHFPADSCPPSLEEKCFCSIANLTRYLLKRRENINSIIRTEHTFLYIVRHYQVGLRLALLRKWKQML